MESKHNPIPQAKFAPRPAAMEPKGRDLPGSTEELIDITKKLTRLLNEASSTRQHLLKGNGAMIEVLENYPVVIEIPVAWGEMDALGHVNNVAYVRYLESSRVAYLDRLKIWDYMEKTGIGPILASVQCRYKIPLVYPDTLSVGARTTRIERDRFLLEHCVFSHKLRKIAAEGSGMLVIYDYNQKKKGLIPEDLRARIEAIEEAAKKF